MIDWELVPDQTQTNNIIGHYYSWDHDISKHKNAKIYNDPVHFDLPADTNLTKSVYPIYWTYIRVLSPKYAVRYNNVTYTNTSDVVYDIGYLEKPVKKFTSFTIDNVSVSEAEFTPTHILVTITNEWHTTSKSKSTGSIKKNYFTSTIYKSEPLNQYNYNRWVTEDEYNVTVECIITNHSGFYSTISMTGLPTNVSYYNISVKLGNVTKYMLKSSYVYFKNETVNYQLYDMYDYDYYDLHGISPYGKDCFLVSKGDIDSISIRVSTPFESYTLNTNITRVDRGKYSTDGDITGAIMCLICVYILYRMLR